jgi:hypothetical protein
MPITRRIQEKKDTKASPRTDGQVECWPGCVACCHHFEHRYCTADCAGHVDTTAYSAAVLCRDTLHTSSSSTLGKCDPKHACEHHHDGLSQRPAYRLPPSKALAQGELPPPNSLIPPVDGHGSAPQSVIAGLSFVDRFLSLWIVLVMVIGVLVGYYSSSAVEALNSVQLVTVSLPVSFGLWFMMYPVLVKVKYESFAAIFRKRDTYRQLLFSISANWVSAPHKYT